MDRVHKQGSLNPTIDLFPEQWSICEMWKEFMKYGKVYKSTLLRKKKQVGNPTRKSVIRVDQKPMPTIKWMKLTLSVDSVEKANTTHFARRPTIMYFYSLC